MSPHSVRLALGYVLYPFQGNSPMSISFHMALTSLVDKVRVDEMVTEINEREPLEKYGRTALLTTH